MGPFQSVEDKSSACKVEVLTSSPIKDKKKPALSGAGHLLLECIYSPLIGRNTCKTHRVMDVAAKG